jgi:diglucosylglycerate octanoyltransferase
MPGPTPPQTRVLVLTDSLAFVGPRVPHPINEPRLWPNVMAEELDVDVEVFGGFGWTTQRGWFALAHDPMLWAALRRADAVVLALGSFDSSPAPLPSFLWQRIPLIRSAHLRRLVHTAHVRILPLLCRLLAPLPRGGPVALRPRLTEYYLAASAKIIRRKRRSIPVVGMSPICAVPKVYGGNHRGRAATERAVLSWATSAGVPVLDTPAVVGDHMLSGGGNPDGMHMGWEGHRSMGVAFAAILRELDVATGAPSRIDSLRAHRASTMRATS